mgnify:CR=1 FL=1
MDADNLILWIAFFSFLSLFLSFKAVISAFKSRNSDKAYRKAKFTEAFKYLRTFNIYKNFFKVLHNLKGSKKHLNKGAAYKKIKPSVKKQEQSAKEKGTKAELSLYRQIKSYFGKDKVFYNLYIEKGEGNYVQIDLLAVTAIGVIVFEVKNYSGWIFADGKSRMWTKILAYGKEKYRFYNPFFQNEGHIRALKHQLSSFSNLKFYSVIVFDGECEIKSLNNLNEGCFLVYKSQLGPFLNELMRRQIKAAYDSAGLIAALSRFKRNSSDKNIVRAHLQKVKTLQQKQ